MQEYYRFFKETFNWWKFELVRIGYNRFSKTLVYHLDIETSYEILPPELFEFRVKLLFDHFKQYDGTPALKRIVYRLQSEFLFIKRRWPERSGKGIKFLVSYLSEQVGFADSERLMKKARILSEFYQ